MSLAVEINAHRGSSHLAPENTLAAIDLAWKQGADAVEIDVHQTLDGRIVVIHDDTTKRTAGIDWRVAERTLAELRTLDVGRWKGERWIGQTIPTLEEVLATIPADKCLLIEIKCGKSIVPELQRIVQDSGKRPAQTLLMSFDFEVASAIKKAMRARPVFWLLDATPQRDKHSGQVVISLEEQIRKCNSAGLDGLGVSRASELTEDFVRKVHAAGLKLHVWTVNSPEEAKKLADFGVDAITTDRPDWLREQLP